jgi:hypothetical protein
MAKNIVAMFNTRDEGERAVRALLDAGVPAERVGMVAGNPREEAKHAKAREVGAGEAAGAAAAGGAAAIAGMIAMPLTGVGTALLAGGAAALGGFGAAAAEEKGAIDQRRLHDVLVHAGLMEEQARVYADDILMGRTMVAVRASDDQTDMLHNLFHRLGAGNIEFRRRD